MRAAFLALALFSLAGAARSQEARLLAPTSPVAAGLSGAWEVAADAAHICRIQFNRREIAPGRMLLGAPAICRRAIPVMAGAAQWGVGEDARIRLFRGDGGLLLTFRREGEAVFRAEGQASLTLTPLGGRPDETPRRDTVASAMQTLTGEIPERDAARAALAGVYALARSRDGEGCAIELQRLPGPRPKKGGAVWTAALASSCRDEGLRIFDPAGWQYDNGRLFLVARKGHSIGFSADGPGGWRKDPAEGRPLWMRKR